MIDLRPKAHYRRDLRINWRHPLTAGLSYFHMLDSRNPRAMWDRANHIFDDIHGTNPIVSSGSGQGMTAGSTTDYIASTNNQFQFTDKFTVLAHCTPCFSPTDGIVHYLAGLNQDTAGTHPVCHLIKWSDNNWYLGVYRGAGENRNVFNASGTYNVGDPNVLGFQIDLNGVFNYTGWFLSGNSGTSGVGGPGPLTFTGQNWMIGGPVSAVSGAGAWGQDGKSTIQWLAVWDRILSHEEYQEIYYSPYCFLERRDQLGVLKVGVPAAPLYARRGVSLHQIEHGIAAYAGTLQADDDGLAYPLYQAPTVTYDAFDGAVVYNTSDIVGPSPNPLPGDPTGQNWDTEDVDTGSFHSTSSNTSRITIGTAYDFRYGIFTAIINTEVAAARFYVGIMVNGSPHYIVLAMFKYPQTGSADQTCSMQVSTPPVLLRDGDYYEAVSFMAGQFETVKSTSSFSLEVVG